MIRNRRLVAGVLIIALLAACAPEAASPATVAALAPGEDTATPAPAEATISPTPSPAPVNAPVLRGETIVLVHLCDASGPNAAAYASRILAAEQVLDALNEEGGIFGADLDLRLADTEGTAEGAQRALARMVRQYGEGPLLLICDPVAEAAIGEQLNEDEIPALSPGVFAEEDGFLFGLDVPALVHFEFFLNELASEWAALRPEDAGSEIRLAVFAWPGDISGQLISDAARDKAEELGVQIVQESELPPDLDANVFDLIYQARDANANVIYTNARGHGLAALLNALNDLGLRDRFLVATPALALDAQTYEYLADPSYAQGLVLTSAWGWYDELGSLGDDLAAQAGDFADWGYLQTAAAIDVTRHALETAILAGGFDALSPETVSDALTSLEGYPALTRVFTVDFSNGNRSLQDLRLWRIGEDGKSIIGLTDESINR